jgi:hypothetical protein
MKEKLINELIQHIDKLDETRLQILLGFIKRLCDLHD